MLTSVLMAVVVCVRASAFTSDPTEVHLDPNSKPMASDCEEEDYCRDEGSKPNYDSPDKGCRFFFAVIAMGMPLHLNLRHDPYGRAVLSSALKQKVDGPHHRDYGLDQRVKFKLDIVLRLREFTRRLSEQLYRLDGESRHQVIVVH
jgi:hypothetical protein